jgi:hypothetical protein
MNRFIDRLQVVTTVKYNIITDFHTTKHSIILVELLSLLSLVFVTALNNGYSFTKCSLSVSWQRIQHMNYKSLAKLHIHNITVLHHM